MDAVSTTAIEESPTGGGGEESYLVLALAVGIPCGLIILVLFIVIIFIVYLTLRTSSSDMEVEATYMHRRFQGLSLEEQRRLSTKQKHKKKRGDKITTRRSSSATDSSKSSVKLTPYSRRAKVRQGNPFGLQEWQLKMNGIDASPQSDETDFADVDTYHRNPIGALNPLMLDESTADYEPAHKGHKSSSNKESSEDDDSASSDSMNPYD